MATSTRSTICPRCKGEGIVPFKHVANGLCFRCKGKGTISFEVAVDLKEYFHTVCFDMGDGSSDVGDAVIVSTFEVGETCAFDAHLYVGNGIEDTLTKQSGLTREALRKQYRKSLDNEGYPLTPGQLCRYNTGLISAQELKAEVAPEAVQASLAL